MKKYLSEGIKISESAIREKIDLHDTWLSNGKKGSRAILDFLNLSHRSLAKVDLRCASLHGANLRFEDLTGADLRGANLSYCDIYGTYLHDAMLTCANLTGTNFADAQGVYNLADQQGMVLDHVRHWDLLQVQVIKQSALERYVQALFVKVGLDVDMQAFSDDGLLRISLGENKSKVSGIFPKSFTRMKTLTAQGLREIAALKLLKDLDSLCIIGTTDFPNSIQREARELTIDLIDGKQLAYLLNRYKMYFPF